MKLIILVVALGLVATAQETLTNEAVVKMVKSGLGESLIVNMIQSQPAKYSLTSDDVIRLKQDGVSEKILAAMVAKGASSGAPSPAGTSATNNADLPPNLDVGIYYKKAGKWEEMLPEVVNWKTGGVLKHLGTGGIVKGDVNGHLQGSHSRNSVSSPIEAVIYAPEGVAITEYQLLRLRENGDSREFRTITGGVLHTSGGTTRDVIPFDGQKVANRTYHVTLPNLGAGEYGFLPPGAVTSANSASIGKMYTFRLPE